MLHYAFEPRPTAVHQDYILCDKGRVLVFLETLGGGWWIASPQTKSGAPCAHGAVDWMYWMAIWRLCQQLRLALFCDGIYPGDEATTRLLRRWVEEFPEHRERRARELREVFRLVEGEPDDVLF